VRPLRLAALAATVLALSAPTAGAQDPPPSVDLVKVQGVIDPALAAYVRGTIEGAEKAGATVILQIDSRGSYRDQAERLGRFIRGACVPVVAWIGPLGARASGGALFIVYSSSLVAMSLGAGIGPATPFDLGTRASREDPSEVRRLGAKLVALAPGSGGSPDGVRRLVQGQALPAGPALEDGAIALTSAGLPDLLSALDGKTLPTGGGPVTVATASRRDRPVDVRFHEIGPVRRLLHGVSTPTAVYVLLVLGLWAIAFELTQPGFGVAGIGGLAALALAAYGLTVVPVHWLGLALLAAGIGLQGLDVVIRRVAVSTVLGTAAFAAGSSLAWRGVAPAIDLSLWLVVLATIAGFIYFGFVLTVALRSRTRVREAQVGLVGLVGEVRSDLDPEGGVYVKGTMWRARSMDGPIPKGTRVRVRGIDGLILRVEQELD
jgi:membrane-bound serine protease (ClpP class)